MAFQKTSGMKAAAAANQSTAEAICWSAAALEAAGHVGKAAVDVAVGQPGRVGEDPERPHDEPSEDRPAQVTRTGGEWRRQHQLEPKAEPEDEKAHGLEWRHPAVPGRGGDGGWYAPDDDHRDVATDEEQRPRKLAVTEAARHDPVGEPGQA